MTDNLRTALSNLDQPHILSITFTYQVPFFNKGSAALDRVSIPAGQSKNITMHVPLRQLQ